MVMKATTGINGSSNQKTQRQPIWSVIVPAIAGASRLGSTQPAARKAYLLACRSAGKGRLTTTNAIGARPPVPAPCIVRPKTTISMLEAVAATTNPAASTTRLAGDGFAGPSLSVNSPVTTSATRLASV